MDSRSLQLDDRVLGSKCLSIYIQIFEMIYRSVSLPWTEKSCEHITVHIEIVFCSIIWFVKCHDMFWSLCRVEERLLSSLLWVGDAPTPLFHCQYPLNIIQYWIPIWFISFTWQYTVGLWLRCNTFSLTCLDFKNGENQRGFSWDFIAIHLGFCYLGNSPNTHITFVACYRPDIQHQYCLRVHPSRVHSPSFPVSLRSPKQGMFYWIWMS